MSTFLNPTQKAWQAGLEKDDSAVIASTQFRYKEVVRWDIFSRHLWHRSGFLNCCGTTDPNCPTNLYTTWEDAYEWPELDDYKAGRNLIVLYKIQGVTKDSVGSPLGGCQVSLFLTGADTEVDSGVSDAAGNYTLYTPYASVPHYVVSFKDPNLTGATVRTLIGQ
jgi:hypothetical protein